MSYQAIKRHGGTLNTWYSAKEINEKRLQTMIPTIHHSKKGKAMETVRASGFRS